MRNSKILKAILFVSGLIAAGIGAAVLFTPEAFYALNGIRLGGDISLLNEIRAQGGALLASGLLIMSGAFVARLTFTAIVLAALFYLAYGLSRIMSMIVDGMPANGLTQATVLEIVIGLACAFALTRFRRLV